MKEGNNVKKKLYYFLCLICIVVVVISGCSSNVIKTDSSNKNSNNTKSKLTLDEIKQSYAKTDEKILSTKEYKNYVLVESQAPTFANRFTLYDLKTGDKDILPSGDNFIDSAKIIDENKVILYAKGTFSESALHVFPYEIHCSRGAENNNSQGDFIPTYKYVAFPINKQISLKGKDKEEIKDILITVNGLQVCFGPQSGNNESFNADYLDIPTTDIAYNETAGEFSLKFHDTLFEKSLCKTGLLSYHNTFIKSLNLKESNDSAIIIIKINKASKYFTGKKSSIDADENGIPYLDIQFTESSTD